jgi:hypothetical protein
MGSGVSAEHVSVLAIALFAALVLYWSYCYSDARPRFIAVLSPSCPHCARAETDMETFGTRGMFTVVDAADANSESNQGPLRELGFSGDVPFLANVETGKSVTGYLPHKELLAALASV